MNQRGQALPLIGIAALVLVGFAGFAVDVGYHQYQQRVQQTATDSAALAAAREIPSNQWLNAGRQDATLNGYTDNQGTSGCDNSTVGRVCVLIDHPPASPDPYAGNAGAVEVRISVNHPTFFERVVGYSTATVVTKAVAVLHPTPAKNCLYVLNGPANFNGTSGGGTVNAPDCGLVFNQGANFNNATVDAASIECVQTCSKGTYTAATPQPAAPASDPCDAMTFCSYLLANPPPCTTAQSLTAKIGAQAVPAGCYSNLDIHKATSVTLCGLYVLTGSLNARNGPAISESAGCSGVTFYVASGGSIDMGGDTINLNAPTTGDYSAYSAGEQNVLIYQAPGNSSTLNLQSATCTKCSSYFTGMIYAPSSNLNYNQYTTTTAGNVLIVAGTLNANGGINSLYNAPGGPPSFNIQVPVLGE